LAAFTWSHAKFCCGTRAILGLHGASRLLSRRHVSLAVIPDDGDAPVIAAPPSIDATGTCRTTPPSPVAWTPIIGTVPDDTTPVRSLEPNLSQIRGLCRAPDDQSTIRATKSGFGGMWGSVSAWGRSAVSTGATIGSAIQRSPPPPPPPTCAFRQTVYLPICLGPGRPGSWTEMSPCQHHELKRRLRSCAYSLSGSASGCADDMVLHPIIKSSQGTNNSTACFSPKVSAIRSPTAPLCPRCTRCEVDS